MKLHTRHSSESRSPESATGFRPRSKYGVTPCQARGRLFFRRSIRVGCQGFFRLPGCIRTSKAYSAGPRRSVAAAVSASPLPAQRRFPGFAPLPQVLIERSQGWVMPSRRLGPMYSTRRTAGWPPSTLTGRSLHQSRVTGKGAPCVTAIFRVPAICPSCNSEVDPCGPSVNSKTLLAPSPNVLLFR